MKTLWLCGALLSVTAASAQPVLRATDPVVNGGSYANAIAPGSIFVIFGTNLAGDAVALAPGLPYPATLAGVSVRFAPAAGGAAADALMVYTTKNQIAGLLPSSAAPGDYNVTVTYNGQTSAPGKAKVLARSLGIVTANGGGTGQAQAQNYRSSIEWDLNRYAKGNLGSFTTAPATPGQALVLWGTGLGADTASDRTGGTSVDLTSSTVVVVGGREIRSVYAGRSPGLPGTDQINFTLPGDITPGCSVPVQVRVGDTLSKSVTLSIAAAGRNACQHPTLSEDVLTRLSQGGSVALGSFDLSKTRVQMSIPGMGSVDSVSEAVGGSFARFDVGNLADFASTELSSVTIGSCVVTRFLGLQEDAFVVGRPPVLLDAGAQLTLNGPNASNIAVPRGQDKAYSKTLYSGMAGIPGVPGIPGLGGNPVIAAGTYTLAGTGGSEVGAFQATITVPTPLDWTNANSITEVNRSQSLPLSWSGGGSNTVLISGLSGVRAGGTETKPIYDMATFYCTANASAGGFTVPSSVLSQLPASGDITSGNGTGMLSLNVFSAFANQGQFTAPLVAGGSIPGDFSFSLGVSKMLGYR